MNTIEKQLDEVNSKLVAVTLAINETLDTIGLAQEVLSRSPLRAKVLHGLQILQNKIRNKGANQALCL